MLFFDTYKIKYLFYVYCSMKPVIRYFKIKNLLKNRAIVSCMYIEDIYTGVHV